MIGVGLKHKDAHRRVTRCLWPKVGNKVISVICAPVEAVRRQQVSRVEALISTRIDEDTATCQMQQRSCTVGRGARRTLGMVHKVDGS